MAVLYILLKSRRRRLVRQFVLRPFVLCVYSVHAHLYIGYTIPVVRRSGGLYIYIYRRKDDDDDDEDDDNDDDDDHHRRRTKRVAQGRRGAVVGGRGLGVGVLIVCERVPPKGRQTRCRRRCVGRGEKVPAGRTPLNYICAREGSGSKGPGAAVVFAVGLKGRAFSTTTTTTVVEIAIFKCTYLYPSQTLPPPPTPFPWRVSPRFGSLRPATVPSRSCHHPLLHLS